MQVHSFIIDHFTFVLMEHFFLLCVCQFAELRMCVKEVYCHFPYDYTWNNASSLTYSCNHQFRSDNGLAMRRNISNVLCVIGAPLFESTLAPRRSIAFRNSSGTWSRAPGKQFGVLDRWRARHTRPARWSDTLRIRPVRWRKWNRIRIDLARLADPIGVILIVKHSAIFMMTSSNGNLFRVTGHLCGEFTGLRWIPRTKASDAGLWCFLWHVPDKRLSKQSWGWWSETQSGSLWRHSNVVAHMVNVNHHHIIPIRLLHNQWPFY